MRFEITRTSAPGDPNCSGAVEEVKHADGWRLDVRDVDCPTKIPAFDGGARMWHAYGRNHTRVDGRIQREVPCGPEKVWFIDLPDLDALKAFVGAHGMCVVSWPQPWEPSPYPRIEIYDELRE